MPADKGPEAPDASEILSRLRDIDPAQLAEISYTLRERPQPVPEGESIEARPDTQARPPWRLHWSDFL